MKLTIQPMDRVAAGMIVRWKYDAPYDLYNSENPEEALNEFLDGHYFKVLDEVVGMVGFCCYGDSAMVPIGINCGVYPNDGSLDVGFGMRPDLTGQGKGYRFVNSVLEFMEITFHPVKIRLTAAHFNSRAIHLYKKLGFVTTRTFSRGVVEFVIMERA